MASAAATGILERAGTIGKAVLGVEKRPYVRAFGVLALLTVVEFQIPFISTDILSKDLQVLFLILFSITKAAIVVAYYMHLRYEPRVMTYVPLASLVLVGALVAVITLR